MATKSKSKKREASRLVPQDRRKSNGQRQQGMIENLHDQYSHSEIMVIQYS